MTDATKSPPPPPPLGPRDFFHLDGRPAWLPTGRVRLRAGWFGRAILEIEEFTEVSDRPAGAAYSPGWWRRVERWVRVKRGDFVWLKMEERS